MDDALGSPTLDPHPSPNTAGLRYHGHQHGSNPDVSSVSYDPAELAKEKSCTPSPSPLPPKLLPQHSEISEKDLGVESAGKKDITIIDVTLDSDEDEPDSH